MEVIQALLLAVGLSMDAFAVAVCKGLCAPKVTLGNSLTCGAWFGGFQALMPTAGFFLGTLFASYIESFDHWVAFGLLVLIGGNMLKEAFSKECDCCSTDHSFGFKTMFVMAVATSIDAMAAGISLAMDGANIWLNALCIGVTTFSLSAFGVKAGSFLGAKFQKKAQFCGGVILILLGCKILLEHLGVLA